jgi:CRP/FNR family cyclic AMP-dependent transcriptional regulator
MSTTASTQAKSGMRSLKSGEVLFNDGEMANSLYIIQKGQIRLFKPKGKGFVEIGILRAGEVIGEMAFFDEDGSGKKRSCSASAMTPVEIIEISFTAFAKTMQSLNPWFKTIINTMASRLRKTNQRVKELEDNQASVSYGGKHTGYEFLKPIEVMRILGTIFLVFKSHGEIKGQSLMINRKTLNLYTNDMYQILEGKLENIIGVLTQLGWMHIDEDADKLPNILLVKNIDNIRQVFIFYNSERHLAEEKRMRISDKCEMLISKIYEKGEELLEDIPNLRITEEIQPKFTKQYPLNNIFEEFKAKNILMNVDTLDSGKNIGIFGEPSMNNNRVSVEIDYKKLQKMYPIIRFINAIKRSNQEKGSD